MEGRALVSKALLTGAELLKIFSRLGDDIIEKVKCDTTRLNADILGFPSILERWPLPADVEVYFGNHVCG